MTEQLFKKIPALSGDHVKILDPSKLFGKLVDFSAGGKSKLQIITDYDLTLTKQHLNGEPTRSSFSLFTLCKSLPPDFIEKNGALKAKYLPIEIDPNLTKEEKGPYMLQWYVECEEHFNGLVLEAGDIETSVKAALPPLRDGTIELFSSLDSKQVPVLVLSAGLGETIKIVLDCYGLKETNYLSIVSNFFKFDEQGVIRGYGANNPNRSVIHPFNKSGLGCKDYFERKELAGRSNVILMGDSLGDAGMDEGVPEVEGVLRIGFLHGTPDHVEKSLPNYMQHFDIVLLDDQTMKIPQAILDQIS